VKSSSIFRTSVCLGVSIITVAFLASMPGCAPKQQESIVATIGTTPISLTDFENMYNRSNGGTTVGTTATQEERERFLDLMIKYRLKLTDAYHQGLDKRPEVLGEINQYRGSLAASYLTDRDVVAPNVRKMYDRSREELRASHILLTFRQDAKAEDSAAVHKQAQEIIAQAKEGKDFGQLAVSFSQDPSAQQNKGDLYYFSTGRMVPEFEDAAYALKAGEVTPVAIKTRFGLHIIKVTDRKPSRGELEVSHIMIRFNNQTPSPEDTAVAYKKVLAIQDSLVKGIPFADLAMRNSEDGGSSGRGGDLGWCARGRWPQPFDEAVFQLMPGQTSPVVRTAYGYHIILCTNARPPKSFEEAKQDFQNLYQQQRFQDDYAAFTAKIKKEVQFVRNDSVVALFVTAFDSTKSVRDSSWGSTLPGDFGRATMFRVLGRPIIVDTVIAKMKSHFEWSNTSLHRTSLAPTVDKLAEQVLFEGKSELLEQQDPKFAALLREYREGILLYQVEQDQVWNKVATSDSLLRLYFGQHRDKFVFPDRVKFTEIRAASEANAQAIRTKLLAGMSMEQVVREDSIRMTAKVNYQVVFGTGKNTLPAKASAPVTAVGTLLQKESATRVLVAAYADTSVRKAKNEELAKKRIDVVKGMLTKTYGIAPERILAETRPRNFVAAKQKDTANVLQHLDLQILGLQQLVIATLDTAIAAPAADERAKHADSLAIGGYSMPFFHKAAQSIVRKDGVEPSRQKEFEEAGAEVSSAFQEYESKRLESEWLTRVRQYAPVIEHKELLKNAFAKTP
jgi:peptidyl-prolyl cis-trans isomerase SurA